MARCRQSCLPLIVNPEEAAMPVSSATLSDETVLLTTEDEGATWHHLWAIRAIRIVGLDFVDELLGWMLQGNGKVLRNSRWREHMAWRLDASVGGHRVSVLY